ncbi:MAG: ABC transporter substrate-binding protein [Oscillospiraceae bacterium]
MKHLRKCTALLLAVLMVFALAACGEKDTGSAVDKDLTVNVVSLNGTTGFGMAKLMADSKAGNAALNYSFTVETDPSNATAALVNGTADIAALPTNAAAALYNKTDGAVQVLALNTRGVLYVVTDGTENITSFADLRGKNVYVPVQNPTFIFQYLCEKNGLTAGTDITIDNTYAQPAELNTALASGEVHIAVLPEPMVTIARAANPELTAALDLTAEWDKVSEAGSLVQGCVVVRKAFADEHPNEVKAFLERIQGVHRIPDRRARAGRPDDPGCGYLCQGRRGRQSHPELQHLLCLRRGDAGAAHGISHRAEHRRPAEHRRQRAGG